MSTLLARPRETLSTPALKDLISAVRSVVQTKAAPQQTGAAVANILRPYLGSGDFLSAEQMAPGGESYRQHILHVEPDGSFSVASLVWLPGQTTPIHDHVSWCVVGVHRGQEHETHYREIDVEGGRRLVAVGEVV